MITAKWDQSKFEKELRLYCFYRPKQTLPDILNTKGFFIARKAIWFTTKVPKEKIAYDLQATVATRLVKLKSGKFSKNKKNKQTEFTGTRLSKIVIAKLRKAGKAIPSGEELLSMLRRVYAGRLASRAFVASGWLPAVHRLAPLAITKAGAPALSKEVSQRGQPKGKALPAHSGQGVKFIVRLWNDAFTNVEKTKDAHPMAAAALQKAFDDETRTMNHYVQEKRAKENAKFNHSQK